ncbi:hypothetical protein [Streptomyces sp. NPDC001851]|uniref:hypothetical protein n=1 Tax=Streptomyces sp. NPDC001851 TaxID=3154529 RepID=UPI00331A6A55
MDRKTVGKYLAPVGGIRDPPRRAADERGRLVETDQEVVPGLTDRRLRQVTWPEIDKHRDYIKNLHLADQISQYDPAELVGVSCIAVEAAAVQDGSGEAGIGAQAG